MITVDGPVVRKILLDLSPPTDVDHLGDLDRVMRGLEAHGLPGVRTPLSIVASLPEILRAAQFRVVATIAFVPTLTLLRLEPANKATGNFALAVDLGSTNIVGSLIDLDTGATVGEHSMLNPQVEHGDDILTRTHFCRQPGGLKQLQAQATRAISLIAAPLASQESIPVSNISCISVAGNTTMAHFLLGLDPHHLCRAPYVPVANSFPVVCASELSLDVHPGAPVIVLPNVGSYVGGDALAGVLVSGMHKQKTVSLLVDIGTNAEIIIGNQDFLFVGAGSAGPGLEGDSVRYGMHASKGAIEHITINPKTYALSYKVIGGGRPLGICGSGLIDLMSELFSAGVIDPRGEILLTAKTSRVQKNAGVVEFVVVKAEDTKTGTEISISQPDIDNFMLAKAAMYTMLSVMTESTEMQFDELDKFFLAGTFGGYIPADKAVMIGMIPDLELSKFRLLGNSSLEGAKQVLLSVAALEEIKQIMLAINYVEMNESQDFMAGFMAARFLPHTDIDRFPTVRNYLERR